MDQGGGAPRDPMISVGDSAPHLSVVIPSVNGWTDLSACLEALQCQRGNVLLDVLVVDRVGETVRSPLRARYPDVRLLAAPPAATIPHMRAMAFVAARAEIVGVIEDHVLVPPDWAQRMLAAQQGSAGVVGGAIENAARDRLTDWAAFLCEYSHCLEPPPAGAATWLAGNNVTYRKSLLHRFRDVVALGRWEDTLHDAMRRAGVTLESRPDIRVGHKMHHSVASYAVQRFLYSRSFAAMRVADAGRVGRMVYGFAALGLPPLLLYRILSRVWRTGRHRRELMLSIPLFIPFVLSWAAGEAVGAWFGPGDALARVR